MRINDIKTRNEFADFLGIQRKTLTYVLYEVGVDSFYKSFDIPKKDGSQRHIHAPTGILKAIQKNLADALYDYQKAIRTENDIKANISHAFEKEKGIITNAQIHRNKRFVLCFDLKDYFESFHFGRVLGFFENNRDFKLPREVAVIIAQITCYNGFLPQGAPSSPVITNLISQIMDYRLLRISKKFHLDYTRYADDLTFSTNDKHFLNRKDEFIEEICAEVTSSGFLINESKTRLVFKDSRQIVTGLIVNKKINIPRTYYKDTRAMWRSFYTTGSFTIQGQEGTANQLEGRFSFIDHIEHYNNIVDQSGAPHRDTCLSTKEKEYRNFLFYKHFINNQKPVLITEGKTDILYIKAALKKLYEEYPTMVSKDSNGRFSFHISFFNKTRHWKYFFGMSKDGADAMKKLYSFFNGNGENNLCDYFKRQNAIFSKNPVFFLFDNEQNSKRPLRTFVSYAKLSDTQEAELKDTNHTLLNEVSNLSLLSVPLPAGKDECELEDLFTEETLATVIGGRTFSRKDEDITKYYNKNIFSKYIYKNYKNIDFSAFRPLLNIISELIT